MKTKKYRYGKFYFNAYCKAIGEGYECGLHYGKKIIFVGNFIHKEEADYWWKTLNKETMMFVKKYWVNENVSTTWYCKFFSTHLYKNYYQYLDKVFANYNHKYTVALKRDTKRYKTLKKRWSHDEAPVFKVA